MYGQLRVREKIRGKKKKGRKPPGDVTVFVGEEGAQVEMRVAEPGAIVLFPIVKPPQLGIFRDPPERNTGWVGTEISHATQGPTQPELWKGLQQGPVTFTGPSLHMPTFGRFIAKVAHGYACGLFGLDRFEPWLPPIILGHDPDFGFLVGSSPTEAETEPRNYILTWAAFPHGDDYLLAVDVALFPSAGQPWIRAVAGRTTAEHARQVRLEQQAAQTGEERPDN
jgi:hypothetical protein